MMYTSTIKAHRLNMLSWQNMNYLIGHYCGGHYINAPNIGRIYRIDTVRKGLLDMSDCILFIDGIEPNYLM